MIEQLRQIDWPWVILFTILVFGGIVWYKMTRYIRDQDRRRSRHNGDKKMTAPWNDYDKIVYKQYSVTVEYKDLSVMKFTVSACNEEDARSEALRRTLEGSAVMKIEEIKNAR